MTNINYTTNIILCSKFKKKNIKKCFRWWIIQYKKHSWHNGTLAVPNIWVSFSHSLLLLCSVFYNTILQKPKQHQFNTLSSITAVSCMRNSHRFKKDKEMFKSGKWNFSHRKLKKKTRNNTLDLPSSNSFCSHFLKIWDVAIALRMIVDKWKNKVTYLITAFLLCSTNLLKKFWIFIKLISISILIFSHYTNIILSKLANIIQLKKHFNCFLYYTKRQI